MKIPPQKEEKLKEHILEGRHLKLDFSTDPIRNLHSCVKVLIEPCHWGHNIRMTNKAEEKQRFLEKIEDEDRYIPDFRFREFRYDRELLLDILEQCIEAADRIEEEELERYGAEKVTPEDLQRFYRDIFREFRFFVELSAGIEREEKWRKYSEKIWPMVERTEFEKSREKMRDIETFEEKKELDSSDLKQMFEDEIDRLDMKWEVEIRQVSGCHNIPEEKTVVVADGEDEKRYYSREEAKMLTVHELFHSVRAYNGYRASKNDLPPILAIHTPFYDRTEEGGALYREKKTGAAYSNKTYDHHLRLVTAYRMAKSEDLKEEFHGIAEDIIEMGADPERVFELMARNREALRHHIYKSGEKAWKEASQKQIDALLIGKINYEYAELFQEEVEAGGMMQEPAIGAKELFEFTFKDSEQISDMKEKVLLDTNFLVAPFQFSFDLFEELERLYPNTQVYTLDDAVQEAKSIRGGKYKDLVEQLIEKKDIEVLETEDEEQSSSGTVEGEGEVDDLIVDISDEFIVGTNDKELKQRLLDDSRPVLIIRTGDHLEVINRRAHNL